MLCAPGCPTRQSFVNELVGGSRLRNAISLNSAIAKIHRRDSPGSVILRADYSVSPGWQAAGVSG